MIYEFVKGVFDASAICTPFSIWMNILVMGLEISYGATMVLVASSISLGVVVPYESYRLVSSLSVVVCAKPTFSLDTTST